MSTNPSTPSEQDDKHSDSDDKLVDVLERCTRELGALCEGLDIQQQEAEDHDEEVEMDTLTTLGEMADECATLLACLEAAENRIEELSTEGDMLVESDNALEELELRRLDHEENTGGSPRQLELAQELDTFADELQELISCLGDSDEDKCIEEVRPSTPPPQKVAPKLLQANNCYEGNSTGDDHTVTDYVEEIRPPPPPLPLVGDSTCQQEKVEQQKNFPKEKNVVGNTTDRGATDEEIPSRHKEKHSHRTKQAVALHVKRLKFRRCGSRPRPSSKAKISTHRSCANEDYTASVNTMRSRFRASSFQRHITRQRHARLCVQQAQTALSQLEATRFRGVAVSRAKPNESQTQQAKPNDSHIQPTTPSTQAQKNPFSAPSYKSYLGNFKPALASPSSEVEPRFLCAVFLYGLRRLGTTYITFNSMEQLEQRVRARFAIDAVASFYREVIEVDPKAPTVGKCTLRGHRNKRLQRVATLDQVNDGDTLCVTQNAYDDMSILCEWIKRRQRVVHSFQQVHQPPELASNEIISSPPKQKSYSNGTVKPQLWDSNGRSVGVKTQLSILSDDLWESNAQ